MIRRLPSRLITMRSKQAARKTCPASYSASPQPKRFLAARNGEDARMIGTHSGTFHCKSLSTDFDIKDYTTHKNNIIIGSTSQFLQEHADMRVTLRMVLIASILVTNAFKLSEPGILFCPHLYLLRRQHTSHVMVIRTLNGRRIECTLHNAIACSIFDLHLAVMGN